MIFYRIFQSFVTAFHKSMEKKGPDTPSNHLYTQA